MKYRRLPLVLALTLGSVLGAFVLPATAQHMHQHSADMQTAPETMHAATPSGTGMTHAASGMGSSESRQLVRFPEPMRLHTLSSMRDHLQVISEIQEAMAKGWFTKAASLAEERLGMTSLPLHDAHESAKFMPTQMQEIGTSMHRNASQFAIEIQNASATGNLKPALAALARTTQSCVACHASYRLQ